MSQLKAVILAAGKGTRMKSDLPKVVHTIEGKCLVDYAIEAAEGAGAGEICLVVGYKYEIVRETISHKDVKFVLQEQQLGTGHAVRCAKDFLGEEGQTLILFGDTPLITAETLKKLREHHIAEWKYSDSALSNGRGSDRIRQNYPRCRRQFCEERGAQGCDGGGTGIPRDQLRYVYF